MITPPTTQQASRARSRSRWASGTAGLLVAMRRRQAANAGTLLMFLIGFIAAPCLHNLDHRDDHDHLPDGSVQAHGERAQPAPLPAPGTNDDPETDAAARDRRHAHGAGALGHFGVALTAPGFFVVPSPPVPVAAPPAPEGKQTPCLRSQTDLLRSRGPPAA